MAMTISVPAATDGFFVSNPDQIRLIAYVTTIGGLLLNIFLCFLNTRIMPVTDSHVMLGEMAVVGLAFAAGLDRRAGPWLFLIIFFAYMLFLSAIRHQLELKGIRDIIIPVSFFMLGNRLNNLKAVDRIAMISAILVVVFALFEYFFLEIYLDYFNVMGYYLARGTLTLQQTYGETRGLFQSGIRPEPRLILPFIGQHRVSSVFLEPVSMGNFGAIMLAWGLVRPDMKGRWWLIFMALFMVTMADARFGLGATIAIILMQPFFSIIPRLFWAVLPIMVMAALAAFGLLYELKQGPDDLAGRISSTAHLMTELPMMVVLGLETTTRFTADSGFAYSLTKFGILGYIVLWGLFAYLPTGRGLPWRFHSMIIVYLVLVMLISNSFYSIKTAALMWLMLGCMTAVSRAQTFRTG